MTETDSKPRRIDELDLLRGFFILVIVIDHFQRWPSLFTYLTGEGRLWTSAAEGFFIISGLLIGYLRGHKQRKLPFRDISKILLKRAAILYIWVVIITFIVVAVSVIFEPKDPLVPVGPNSDQVASLGTYIGQVITQTYSNDWIFFLRLYAIMLLISPIFIWLLRRGKWWIAAIVSLLLYAVSFLFERPEAALQWQVLFFGAGLIGYKLESIRSWLALHPIKKHIISASLVIFTLFTMALSYFFVLGFDSVGLYGLRLEDYYALRTNLLDPLFENDPMMPARVLLSFIWFGGLFAIFHYARGVIMRGFDWLLMLFGQRSLSAYCLQALFFLPVQYFVFRTDSIAINTAMTVVIIVMFWGILRIPIVQKVLPK